MLIALVLSIYAQSDETAQKVAALVVRLEDDSASERDKAQKELIALGRAAVPHIQKQLDGTRDPEVKARLQDVLSRLTRIQWERDLNAALARAKKAGKPLLVFSTIGEPDGYA